METDVPFLSICSRRSCHKDGTSYCYAGASSCLNKVRDHAFWEQHQFETDIDHYPDSAFFNHGTARFMDKRLLRLRTLAERPGFVSGPDIIHQMESASLFYAGKYSDANETVDEALAEIAALDFIISVEKWQSMLLAYFH